MKWVNSDLKLAFQTRVTYGFRNSMKVSENWKKRPVLLHLTLEYRVQHILFQCDFRLANQTAMKVLKRILEFYYACLYQTWSHLIVVIPRYLSKLKGKCLHFSRFVWTFSQPVFTCSRSNIETPWQFVKSVPS